MTLPDCDCAACSASRSTWRRRLFAHFYERINTGYEPLVADHKRALFAPLQGDVLEIGPGIGSNLRFLPAGVRWTGLEPNPHMHAALQREADRLGQTVELQCGEASDVGAADASFDAVISTLVLCSVADVARALTEIRRVLRPGGGFFFIEHVAAPRGTMLRRMQRVLRPLNRWVADNCHPDRETGTFIDAAGFGRVELRHLQLPLPLFSPHIIGVATK